MLKTVLLTPTPAARHKTASVETPPVLRIGLPDAFPHKYGLQEELFEIYGLTPAQIAARTVKSFKVKDKVA